MSKRRYEVIGGPYDGREIAHDGRRFAWVGGGRGSKAPLALYRREQDAAGVPLDKLVYTEHTHGQCDCGCIAERPYCGLCGARIRSRRELGSARTRRTEAP